MQQRSSLGPILLREGSVARRILELYQSGMTQAEVAKTLGHADDRYVGSVVRFHQKAPLSKFWQRLEEIEQLLLEILVLLRQISKLPKGEIAARTQRLLDDAEQEQIQKGA